ncbi:MAG: right-handed parallel beta-helix repeat-containing protein [Planctomycetaceae bacterium]
MTRPSMNRRTFSQIAAAASAGWAASYASAEEPPKVVNPRATSGDAVAKVNWEEMLTVTVGPKEADLVGTTERALQGAVDMVARLGGGTVKVLPGTYRLRNSIYLASKVRLVGSGDDSVLIKEPSVTTKIAADSDWYDQEILLEDAKGFRVGDAVCLRTKNPHNGGTDICKRTLVARSGNRFKLDKALRQNFWQMGNTTVSTLFPILSGELIEDFAIENVRLDGNKAKNENLDGNYAGCIFLQDCNRGTFRGVHAHDYNGDGLSWQICHDMLVEDCYSHDHVGLGMHPGSGSQRTIMRSNRLEGNAIGIFFCWGVKFGLAEKNILRKNRTSISIGHRDTDNLVCDNRIEDSGEVAVLFRPERGVGFSGNRNRIVRNTIVNTGGEKSAAIDIQGNTEAIQLEDNVLEENRSAAERIAIQIGADTKDITVARNQIKGFKAELRDLRKA